MKATLVLSLLTLAAAQNGTASSKLSQLQEAVVDTNGQVETDTNGVLVNTSNSLRAGPRGYVLLEDTAVRKKLIHFDRERAPERVVHALGTGAYGMFESYGDWSNITSACWLQSGAVSETFTRLSVVVASTGGSESARDTHGFATKIYSSCGNQDLVGNHLSSFFINDGSQFPDLIHAVKAEPNTGFPTDGTAHTTAYDFFTQHPEAAFQTLNVISDLGIPRDLRHIGGFGIHTYRFINSNGQSTLFKWYWLPVLGFRSLIYDEAQILSGKNNNFPRMDLYNNIEAGVYPEWEFAVQMFPDDGTYMWNGYDLLVPTEIVPFEMNQPVKLGKLTLNKNFRNYFGEVEQVQFSPSNVVDGYTFVPDPLLQWRLMSYDDTSTHRHNSPNAYELPVNRPIPPVYNNYRDGYMQSSIFVGDSDSTPNNIGGVVAASPAQEYSYGNSTADGEIGRYTPEDPIAFLQARQFWQTMSIYGQQHTVDGFRFELGNVANTSVAQSYIDNILAPVDSCLARRVAYGIGLQLPAMTNSSMISNSTQFPSLYQLDSQGQNRSNAGLTVAVLATNAMFSQADLNAMMPLLNAQQVNVAIVAPRMGTLSTGVNATQSYITASSVFYDAVFVPSSNGTCLDEYSMDFVQMSYNHGKPIGMIGDGSAMQMMGLGGNNASIGVFTGGAGAVTSQVLGALSYPSRFFNRFPVDDVAMICGQ